MATSQKTRKSLAEDLELVVKLLPGFAIILIFFGVSTEMVYYKFFSIPVQYFLTLSEIAFLFFDNILSLILMGGLAFFFLLLAHEFEKEEGGQEDEAEPRQTMLKMLAAKMKVYKYTLLAGGLVLAIASLMEYWYVRTDIRIVIFCAGILIILGTVLALAIDITFFRLSNKINHVLLQKSVLLSGLKIFSVILLIWPYFIKSTEALFYTKYEKRYYGTIIQTKDTTYVSDSTQYYIGKTQDFIFMYNEPDDKSIVLPVSELKMMTIKEKGYFDERR